MYSVSETVARALIPHVDRFFGIMGNGNAWFVDALERLGHGIVTVRHEVATVAAADAYHRVTRRPAVATTTYGPGYTNTLTALAEAAMSRTPLILVVGSAPLAGPRPWDIDQTMTSSSVGVETFTIGVQDAGETTIRALAHALHHSTPVVLAIPYDVAALETTMTGATIPELPEAPPLPFLSNGEVAELATALTQAQRPLILAGRGARPAAEQVRQLATRLRADVATTAPARGIFTVPEQSPDYRDLGVCGGFAAEGAAEEMRRADVVLALGASLNQFTMAFGDAFSSAARMIQIDLANHATHTRVDVFYTAHVPGAVANLLEKLADRPELDNRPAPAPVPELTARPEGDELASDGRLDPRSLMVRLNRTLPADRLVASDGGHFIGWANTYFDLAGPDHIVLLGTAFQSIGLGFPTAIGVAEAAGERTTVLVTGDGGGLMGIADAESFIRRAHRGVVIVFNDAAYGAEIHQYASRGLAPEPMMIPEVDFAAVFRGLGAQGSVIRTLDDLGDFEEWLESDQPGTYLLDCRVSQKIIAPYMQEMVGA